MSKKVSIQGLPGSFHGDAAKKYFGPDVDLLFRDDFKTVFDDIKDAKSSHAVVAYTNSKYGPIYEVEDLIIEYNPRVINEVKLDIAFCLLGIKGSIIEDIKAVYSQKPAIIQCSDFLQNDLSRVEAVEHFDTAGAASDIAKWNDGSKAALASESCAELYDLEILARNVEDSRGDNQTNFYVLSAS